MPSPSLPPLFARAALTGAALVALLLTGCASVALPPPAPPQVPTDEATRYPPPQPRVWTQPPVDTPMDTPSVPTPAQSAPIAAPAVEPPASLPASPRSEPPPPAPAQAPAPAPARASGAAVSGIAAAAARPAAGRWSVQVGVFAVEGNAAALRSRVMQRLADQAPALPVHAAQRDGRTHVLVGDVPDRASAMQLAARLRTLLQQDTVLFRW